MLFRRSKFAESSQSILVKGISASLLQWPEARTLLTCQKHTYFCIYVYIYLDYYSQIVLFENFNAAGTSNTFAKIPTNTHIHTDTQTLHREHFR